ncbi:MAG: shikimate kinase [Cellvibrionaceae bacterium]
MLENIILIGMPGSGKSTTGVQLAKHLGLNFIDTDLLIQTHQQQKLQDILNAQGYQVLRDMEEQELLQLTLERDLVSTGGSAVYSDKGMQHLKKQGLVIYLQVSLEEITRRIDNEDSRGIARPEGQSLEDVYNERIPLYEKYADITIDNNHYNSIEDIASKITF